MAIFILWRYLNMLKKILFIVIMTVSCIFNILPYGASNINTSDSYNEFIDNCAFEYINKIYSDIDFSSDFKQGNHSVYSNYKAQYLKLLECKIPFKSNGMEYYIDKYIYGDYEPEKYIYYFFDVDDDSSPELCIENEVGHIYIMKYSPVSDEVILWHETSSSWTELLGSEKLWFYSGTSPIKYAFYSLDKNGNIKYSVWLYIESSQSETKYLLTLPEYSDKTDDIEIPNDIKAQSIEKDSHYYYRVTESQWNELTKDFFTQKNIAKENILKVRFTYKELFNY